MAGMRLTGHGKVLSCQSKTNKTGGNYFMILVGGEGWGKEFYSKDFVEPNSTQEIEVVFDWTGEKPYLDVEDLKIKLAALKMVGKK